MNNTAGMSPFFIADNRALDVLNSIAKPSNTEIDWISNGHDLLDWLEQGELLNSCEIKRYRASAELVACDAIAIEVRSLREWFRTFVTAHAGKALDTSALKLLAPLNIILAKGNMYEQIECCNTSDGKTRDEKNVFYWKRHRHSEDVDNILFVIAEVMGDLICKLDFSLVKKCEGPTCTLWFYDVSKNHSRRWCTMSVCGNRAKAALHRAKKKSLESLS